MRHLSYLASVGIALLAFGCKLTPDWQELHSAEGKFTALMPGKAVKEIRRLEGGTYTHYTVDFHSVRYEIIHTDLLPGEPSLTLMRFKDYWKREGWTVTKVKETPVRGCKWELEAQKNDSMGQLYSGRSYHAGNRAYEVKVMGSGAKLSNPYIRKFLDSFTITE